MTIVTGTLRTSSGLAGAGDHKSEQHEHREFLAVGTIVVLWVFSRQRGSAESRPVHAIPPRDR